MPKTHRGKRAGKRVKQYKWYQKNSNDQNPIREVTVLNNDEHQYEHMNQSTVISSYLPQPIYELRKLRESVEIQVNSLFVLFNPWATD